MENHPIPQNVTGFEFKLIGNMTIKQFAYLATGVVLAWIIVASPLSIFIKFPVGFIIGFIGFALAFIPVDGRPLDAMALYFIRALFTPNQFVFQKGALAQTQLAYPSPITVKQQPVPQTPAPLPKQQPTTVAPPQPTAETDKKTAYDQILAQLSQTQNDKAKLEQELAALKQTLAQIQKPPLQTPPPQSTAIQSAAPVLQQQPPPVVPAAQPVVKKITITPGQKPTGLAIPDAPNILTGIVKDPRGNILSNILVEVKDKDASPVRAFKTNALGQFASATSLLNGVYTLEFEDPQGKHTFDALELTMNGEIIGPIEVTSIDQREQLRKSLFPNT